MGDFAENSLDAFVADGFGEMLIETRIAGHFLVMLLSVAGKCNETSREVFITPQCAGNLVAGHVGQADIQNSDIRMKLPCLLDCLRTGVRTNDLMTRKRKQTAESVGHARVVVYDEDFERVMRCRWRLAL